MSRRSAVVYFLLFLILIFAAWLRVDAFWLPHWKGDQNHYVALAMKLDKQGLSGYHLRGIRTGRLVASRDPLIELAFCRIDAGAQEGDILRTLRLVGQGYYDEPLHYRAPLFSYLLMGSHRLFAARERFYGVCSTYETPARMISRPSIIFKAQFWAVIVSLFFNLAVIVVTFWLGCRLFNDKIGLVAAFLMASNPLSLFLAYKLLVEDVVTFFAVLALGLYYAGFNKKNYFCIMAAGLSAGLAILSKQTAGLVLPAVWAYTFLEKQKTGKRAQALCGPELLVFASGASLVSGFWFFKVWQTYGTLLHQPSSVLSAMKNDQTGWFGAVTHRPPPLFFFSLGVIGLSPFFSFMFLSARTFYRQVRSAFFPAAGGVLGSAQTILWLWVAVFFFFLSEPWHVLVLTASQEHRFFYPAYPALAVLAAVGWENFARRWRQKIGKWDAADLVLVTLLIFNACWGVPPVLKFVLGNNLLF